MRYLGIARGILGRSRLVDTFLHCPKKLPAFAIIAASGFAHENVRSKSPPAWHICECSFAKAKKSVENKEEIAYEDKYPMVKDTAQKSMQAAMDALTRELNKLRPGRASSGMLDHVVVESDGVRFSLDKVAAVTVLDSQTLKVMPYDPTLLKEVERAIRASPLKLSPITAGSDLSVPIPKPTKEHIETMTKLVNKAGEASKQSIRRARQIAMDHVKKSSGHVSKDDIKRREKEIEDFTKKFMKSAEDTCEAKEKDLLPM